jgi:hypothetical protein
MSRRSSVLSLRSNISNLSMNLTSWRNFWTASITPIATLLLRRFKNTVKGSLIVKSWRSRCGDGQSVLCLELTISTAKVNKIIRSLLRDFKGLV